MPRVHFSLKPWATACLLGAFTKVNEQPCNAAKSMMPATLLVRRRHAGRHDPWGSARGKVSCALLLLRCQVESLTDARVLPKTSPRGWSLLSAPTDARCQRPCKVWVCAAAACSTNREGDNSGSGGATSDSGGTATGGMGGSGE